jgi:general secretion pathway protein J
MTEARRLHAKANSGFTLVEMLVALGLLSFMSLLILSALRLGGLSATRLDHHARAIDETAAAQDLLRQLISQAYPAVLRHADGNVEISFRGASDNLEISAPIPPSLGPGGYYRVRLALVQSAIAMAWHVERNRPERLAQVGALAQEPLLGHVERLRFAYYGARKGSEVPAWHSEWAGEMAPPRLVRVEVERSSRSDGEWPPLYIAPRVDIDATCVFDPLTGGCRGR